MSEVIPPISDEALMVKVCQDDLEAFEILAGRYQQRLYAFALGRLRERTAAEDVVQETLLKVFKHRLSFRAEARFSTWAFTLALNLIRDHYRRLKPESSMERPEVALAAEHSRYRRAAEAPDRGAEKAELSELLLQAIEALPPSSRALIKERLKDGVNFEAAAKQVGLTPEAARTTASRAYKRLRAFLEKRMGQPTHGETES